MTTAAPNTAGRVLLLSTDGEPIDHVAAALHAAGYDVRRCVDDGAASYPCNGLRDGCPIDAPGGVDVALDVRQLPWPAPTTRETGVICALRASVPVAVLSERRTHPFRDRAAVTADRAADVVEVCERAIDAGLESVRRAMTEAVRSVLAVHGIDGSPSDVQVTKRHGRIQATITLDAPDAIRGMAATRAAAALRGIDDRATAIEIDVVAPTPVER